MSYPAFVRILFLLPATALVPIASASDDPVHERHELMEGVGDAAKPIGKMFKGERAYDMEVVMASLKTWQDASRRFGDLFPVGSETGEGTEAAPAIWEDRAGFDEALDKFRQATEAALAASPETLEAAKPAIGPVFETCKGCHDTYRIEDE